MTIEYNSVIVTRSRLVHRDREDKIAIEPQYGNKPIEARITLVPRRNEYVVNLYEVDTPAGGEGVSSGFYTTDFTKALANFLYRSGLTLAMPEELAAEVVGMYSRI